MALAALSVGGMVLARTIPDVELASDVRAAAHDHALAMMAPSPPDRETTHCGNPCCGIILEAGRTLSVLQGMVGAARGACVCTPLVWNHSTRP